MTETIKMFMVSTITAASALATAVMCSPVMSDDRSQAPANLRAIYLPRAVWMLDNSGHTDAVPRNRYLDRHCDLSMLLGS